MQSGDGEGKKKAAVPEISPLALRARSAPPGTDLGGRGDKQELRRIPRKKRQSKSHGGSSAQGSGTAGGTPPCRAIAGRPGGSRRISGCLAVGIPAVRTLRAELCPGLGHPGHTFIAFICLFLPPPPPKPANCPLQQKGSQLCKKRDVKNPTQTPLFYCAFPRLKANPNPKLFILGGYYCS